jgi:hypothetical protein
MHQRQSINQIRKSLGLETKEYEKEAGIRAIAGDFWGFPDGKDCLSDNCMLYYEIEDGQHHPDTNVLKYWPILEENPSVTIVLVQWLRSKPKSRNRWKLAQFVARKMVMAFPDRFDYIFLEYDDADNENKLKQLKSRIAKYGKSAIIG